ncbi:MAG: hypothetical protein ABR500_14110 [Dermatophilaceae bacterium]|nr:hypothetical protein [Intrasporangiaceae bacterium]
MGRVQPSVDGPHETPALAAIKTYRYLRLALVGLVVLLFASLAIEWLAVGRECVQPTISAYWHTPVRGVFVGVLVTMGICLIALKGNTHTEDILLNLAGILAPGVAFIPTAAFTSCSSVPADGGDSTGAVANNMQSLFVLGVVAVAVALILAVRERGGVGRLGLWDRIGLALGLSATTGGAVWFYVSRSTFIEHGHNLAAIPMFLAIVAVVWVNARDVREVVEEYPRLRAVRGRYVAAYRGISVAMLAALGLAVVGHLVDWTYALLAVELLLIALFGVFWIIQTRELWNQGRREQV